VAQRWRGLTDAARIPCITAVTITAPLSVAEAASVACPSIKAKSPRPDKRKPSRPANSWA
jgi:hypothetical protein